MDDLISRQAALDALDELCDRICEYSKKQRHTMCGSCNLGSAFDVINELPTAEKRGKWVRDGSRGANRWVCSECGYKWFFECARGMYCPNCGADMRGQANEMG